MAKYKEFDKGDLSKNELLKDNWNNINTYSILGHQLDTIWWKQITHEKLSTGEVGSGYQIDFVDGTQLKLSTLQLFSIINDYELTNIETHRWTLHELDADTWKGTVREEEFYVDVTDSKVYVTEEE
jgi:hypothetical protein